MNCMGMMEMWSQKMISKSCQLRKATGLSSSSKKHGSYTKIVWNRFAGSQSAKAQTRPSIPPIFLHDEDSAGTVEDPQINPELTAVNLTIEIQHSDNDEDVEDLKPTERETLDAEFQNLLEKSYHTIRVKAKDIDRENIRHKLHKKLDLKDGDLVYLRLHHGYNLPGKQNPKLSNQRTGPFKIEKKVGSLAYKLELPRTMRIK